MTEFDEFARREVIGAPASQILPWLINFRLWRWWSPWENLDPQMRRRYRGLLEGTGASYEWEGNRKAGSGHMEITHVRPTSVEMALSFSRPFHSRSLAKFDLLELPGATNVVWTVRNPRTLGSRALGKVMNMDKALGKDLERGLGGLKQLVESGAEPTI